MFISDAEIKILLAAIPQEYKVKVQKLLVRGAVEIDKSIDLLEHTLGVKLDEAEERMLREAGANWFLHQFRAFVKKTEFNTQTINNMVLQIADQELGVPGFVPHWWHESIDPLPA